MRLLSCFICLFLLTGCHTEINDVPVYDSNTFTFLEEDFYIPTNTHDLIPLDLSSSSILIDEPGNYILSGHYQNTSITINLIERGNVRLILNNLEATANQTPFLSVVTPTKVTISQLEDTNNSLRSDQTVIETNGPITFSGQGNLSITSPTTTLSSKKVISFCGGNYHFVSGKHGLVSDEIIAIHSGNININSQNNGLYIHNENGLVYMLDGNLTITSTDLSISNEGNTNIVGGVQTFKK